MNRGNIRARARRKLDELTAKFWSDNDLNDYINEGYFYYWEILASQSNAGPMKTAFLSIVASVAEIALPLDYVSAVLVERFTSTGKTIPLSYRNRTEASNNQAASSGDAYIPNYRFVAEDLILEPTSISNISNGIKLTYYFQPGELTSDSDSPDPGFKELFHWLLVYYTVVAAKEKEEALGLNGVDLGPVKAKLNEMEAKFMNITQPQTQQRQYTEPYSTGNEGIVIL